MHRSSLLPLVAATALLAAPADAAIKAMTLSGESMRTGEAVDVEMVYRGSHVAADAYTSSEMPAFQDMRLGNRVVLFYETQTDHPAGAEVNLVWNYASAYRCENVLGQTIVMGKGEGSAFVENVSMAQARDQVRLIHEALELDAAKSAEK